MKYKLSFLTCVLFITACRSGLDPQQLYGTWKYETVENPNQTPPDSVGHEELEAAAPTIKFTEKDSLIITWGGKVLSHGKFTIVDQNIEYVEDIPGGKRKFPFYVSMLDGNNLIFETLGKEGTRVTAIKE